MIQWILTAAMFIALPFLEYLFRASGFVSIFAVAAILAFSYLKVKDFLLIFGAISVILDITFHLNMGTHLFAVSLSAGILLLLSSMFPSDSLFTKPLLILLTLSAYWIVFSILFSIQDGAGLSVITWGLLFSAVGKSIFGTLIYLLAEYLVSNTRGDFKSALKFK